jgi:NADH-quinone oxidoreductase subunit A
MTRGPALDPRVALLMFLAIAGLVLALALGLAARLRETSRSGFGIYESGAPPGAPLREPLTAQFFLLAVLFMIFDVEAALLFAWASAATESGRSGLIAASLFIVMLLAALAYLSMDGALATAPVPRDRARARDPTHP